MPEDEKEDDRIKELYADHVAALGAAASAALAAAGFDALVIHSGTPLTYFSDDQEAPFHTAPAFAHWLPLTGPHHLLFIRSRERPLLIRVTPEDFWYEHAAPKDEFWNSAFEIREVSTPEAAWKELLLKGNVAFVGPAAAGRGIKEDAINHPVILSHLEWQRSLKTPYEVTCIEEANHIASHGHMAARILFRRVGTRHPLCVRGRARRRRPRAPV